MIKINLMKPQRGYFRWREGKAIDIRDQKAIVMGVLLSDDDPRRDKLGKTIAEPILKGCDFWPQCDMWYLECEKCGYGQDKEIK